MVGSLWREKRAFCSALSSVNGGVLLVKDLWAGGGFIGCCLNIKTGIL